MTQNEKTANKILGAIQANPKDTEAYKDYFEIIRLLAKENRDEAYRRCLWLRSETGRLIKSGELRDGAVIDLYDLNKKTYLFMARDDFDSYCIYLEWNREPEKRFYRPRRKVLKRVAEELQALADGGLDLLAISLPPGAGKTTIAIFYLTWLAGKFPDSPMLTGSHSNSFVRGVYDECLRIFDPAGDYLWHDVFPGVNVSNTNAKDCRIDLGGRKRFETLEFTSIGTGNAGLYRAATLLYCDDLVSGIEVALSKERLDKLWETYTTDLRQRKIGNKCRELHIATRWSVHDVIGRLEAEYGGSPRAKFITIPAMNSEDESNFDYPYSLGFTTEFYRQQRDIMDDASWRALYMNEPIEREGLLYHEEDLRRYFELPRDEKGEIEPPDGIISICDPKEKGTDYWFQPIAYVYGQDYYIDDCICDNGAIETLDVRSAEILLKHRANSCLFESNSAGWRTAEKIQGEIREKGGRTHITTKRTTQNKETKIILNSAWIKEHCLFKDSSRYKRSGDYGRMINFLCSWTMAGKNKHDDVPDGMAMLAEYAQGMNTPKVEVSARFF